MIADKIGLEIGKIYTFEMSDGELWEDYKLTDVYSGGWIKLYKKPFANLDGASKLVNLAYVRRILYV